MTWHEYGMDRKAFFIDWVRTALTLKDVKTSSAFMEGFFLFLKYVMIFALCYQNKAEGFRGLLFIRVS